MLLLPAATDEHGHRFLYWTLIVIDVLCVWEKLENGGGGVLESLQSLDIVHIRKKLNSNLIS